MYLHSRDAGKPREVAIVLVLMTSVSNLARIEVGGRKRSTQSNETEFIHKLNRKPTV